MDVIIIGAGIGGLTLGLSLHRAGIPCRIFEAASAIEPIGVGINVLPHATRELAALDLEGALARVGVSTAEACFFNRFGQLIYREPLGRAAGYDWPQFSIHRGDLQQVLADAFVRRAGTGPAADRMALHRVRAGWEAGPPSISRMRRPGRACRRSTARSRSPATASIRSSASSSTPTRASRVYSGCNMWRGVTRWPRFLSGASMVRAGWLATGKMVIYPIRNDVDDEGRQLSIGSPKSRPRSTRRAIGTGAGALADFLGAFKDWRFDWLDVPAMIGAADMILEFPMVDQDPLPRWSFGRVTLLGRRGASDGAARLERRRPGDRRRARARRLPVANRRTRSRHCAPMRRSGARRPRNVVRTNRTNPPDAILREVYLRTGDRPFDDIDEVISRDELRAISEGYKRVAGYDRETLARRK